MAYVAAFEDADLQPICLQLVMATADGLSCGPVQQCYEVSRRLMRFIIDSAQKEGDHLLRANWLRQLLLLNRANEGDAVGTHRLPPDSRTARALVSQIFDSLRSAGRGVGTECAICTDPLDPADVN